MFCPECGTWNRALAASCSRCSSTLPDVASTPTEKPDEEITSLRRATGARYRILKRLGGGGMATVFRAEQTGRTKHKHEDQDREYHHVRPPRRQVLIRKCSRQTDEQPAEHCAR